MIKKGIRQKSKYMLLVIAILILLSPFLVNGYYIKNDFLLQHVPFYQEFFNMLDELNIGWSWNFFLGINFWGSKAYYLVGDVFAWLAYLLYKFNCSIINSMLIVTFIKLFIAGLGFEKFLCKLSINAKIRSLFAIAYVTAGWVTIFIEQPVFISFYTWIPFLLLGTEQYLQENKYCCFVVSSALLLMCQYYLMWPLCIMLLIYWIIRYIQVNENFKFKKFWISSIKLFGYFLIALLISSIIWLPSLLHLLSSPRISGNEALIEYGWLWSKSEILQILQNFFIPVIKSDQSLYRGYWYYFYQIGIYCGCFTILLNMIYPFIKGINKKEKLTNCILQVFAILILLSPKIGLIFHFTYSLRYVFITEIILLIIGAKALEAIVSNRQINKKVIISLCFIAIVLIMLLGVYLPWENKLSFSAYPEIKMYIIAAVTMIIYAICLLIDSKKLINIFIFVAVLEMLLQGTIAMHFQINNNKDDQKYINNEEILQNIIYDIKVIDNSFYRVYFDGELSNIGLYFDVPSIATYDSTYEYCLRDFLYIFRQYPDVSWDFKLSEPQLFELLDVKYVITNEDLDQSTWQYFGKEILTYDNGYKVYIINDNQYLGRSYNDFVSKEEMMSLSENENIYLHELTEKINDAAIVDDPKEYAKYHNADIIYLEPSYISNDTVIFEFESDDDQFIFFSIPNDKGWKVYDNDQQLEKIDVNGGFIGIEVPAGKHIIRMEYSIYGIKIAGMLSFTGVLAFLIILWRNKQKNLLK